MGLVKELARDGLAFVQRDPGRSLAAGVASVLGLLLDVLLAPMGAVLYLPVIAWWLYPRRWRLQVPEAAPPRG